MMSASRLGLNYPRSMACTRARNSRERFQAKWLPVRVKKTRQNKKIEPRSDSIGTEKALAYAFVHHEAARDRQFAQRAGDEFLRPVQIAPRVQLEILECTEIAFEWRQQAGHAHRRMRAVVERQQQ